MKGIGIKKVNNERRLKHSRRTPNSHRHRRQYRVAPPEPERGVHPRREEREAEARDGAQEGDCCESCTINDMALAYFEPNAKEKGKERTGRSVQTKRVDDVYLDRLEVQDDARADECSTLHQIHHISTSIFGADDKGERDWKSGRKGKKRDARCQARSSGHGSAPSSH